eukprot:TRINITY_DN9916_c0_g3_i1.p1 TRINITY_DN9916_c0_g3~~TRINITY_DN9916_c0_g3_i1.p1  ORF type:complete len:358 (+),score=88.61 TRINITY_DN9916_c0_g3_i1:170-1243(+)
MLSSTDSQGSKVVLPLTEEVMACSDNHATLEPSAAFKLRQTLGQEVTLRGGSFLSASWPAVELRPLQFAWEICTILSEKKIEVGDVRVEGNAVAQIFNSERELTDIELIFNLDSSERSDLFASREIVLDALCKYLPPNLASNDKHMIAAAYMQRMFITPPTQAATEPAWAVYTLPGTAGSPAVHGKFIQVAPQPAQLDEYAVHVILSLDQLKEFVESYDKDAVFTESDMPEIRLQSLLGTPAEAIDMLSPARRKSSGTRRRTFTPLRQPQLNGRSPTGSTSGTKSNLRMAVEPHQENVTPAPGYFDKVTEGAKAMVYGCGQVMTCACMRPKQRMGPRPGQVQLEERAVVAQQPTHLR